MAPLYTPFSAVCIRTLTRSNGCPTTTAQMPPTPPAASARSDCSEDLLASLMSSFNSSLEGKFSALSGLLVGAIVRRLQRRARHTRWLEAQTILA
jgi:hypothetical protein